MINHGMGGEHVIVVNRLAGRQTVTDKAAFPGMMLIA